jgi:hypothetical protein
MKLVDHLRNKRLEKKIERRELIEANVKNGLALMRVVIAKATKVKLTPIICQVTGRDRPGYVSDVSDS